MSDIRVLEEETRRILDARLDELNLETRVNAPRSKAEDQEVKEGKN